MRSLVDDRDGWPALPGATESLQLADMRSMMTRGGMMGGSGMMGQGDWRHFRRGMMRVLTLTTVVPAGTVSLAFINTGYLTHELLVLPLRVAQVAGSRMPDGADGTVDESGGLGEASATRAVGKGDGIAAGSTGWVTLHLPTGRYELVCNLPGHYTAGMFAELDVR